MPNQFAQHPFSAQFANQGQSLQQLGSLFGSGANVAALMSSLPSLAGNSLVSAPHIANYHQQQFEHGAGANNAQGLNSASLQQVQDDHLQLPLYGSLAALGSDVKPSSTGHNIEEHKGLNLPVERS
jgi:hypothetical protein